MSTVIGSQLRETYSVLYLSCRHSVRHPDRTPPVLGTTVNCDACYDERGAVLLTNTSADRRGTANERGRVAKDVIK